MIGYYIIITISALLSGVFNFLPKVTALPTVLGVNIDTTLQQYVSMFYQFANTFWPLRDLMVASLILLGYYTLMMVVRLLVGHRAPR